MDISTDAKYVSRVVIESLKLARKRKAKNYKSSNHVMPSNTLHSPSKTKEIPTASKEEIKIYQPTIYEVR